MPRRTLIVALAAAALAGCAPAGPDAGSAALQSPLVIEPQAGADYGDETVFTRSVSARYGEGLSAETIVADLREQGFTCEALAPVEATAAYGLFSCARAVAVGVCFDTYAVRIAHDPRREGDLATADGDYARRCLGAAP